jgi:hypothetical protein
LGKQKAEIRGEKLTFHALIGVEGQNIREILKSVVLLQKKRSEPRILRMSRIKPRAKTTDYFKRLAPWLPRHWQCTPSRYGPGRLQLS